MEEVNGKKYEILTDFTLSNLQDNPDNPRRHTNIEAIKRSIIKNGFRTPIIVDEKNVILAGHGRKIAMQELGQTVVPIVVKFYDLTEEQKKDFMIRDNRTTEMAEWDLTKLYNQFDPMQLKDLGFDILREQPSVKEQMKLEMEINRQMDYIVMFFDNESDFVYCVNKFGLEEVMNAKNKRIGRARVVDAKKVMSLFSDHVTFTGEKL